MNMGGYEAAKKVADKLKEEKEEVEQQELATKEEVKNQLAELSGNTALAQMYQDSAQIGAQNLSSELPLLKVHAMGRSTRNELADGTEPSDGAFFYKPTAEQFTTVYCHVLTISKGFKAQGMVQGDGSVAKEVFNQILGGVIIDGGDYKPFLMYFTGLKLSYLWEFGKQASKFTKARPVNIPMFALTVKLTTEKVKTNFGNAWVVKFDIERNEDTSPKLVMDPGEFQFLKDSVDTVQEMIDSIIDAKTLRDTDDTDQAVNGEIVDTTIGNVENIPF